MPPPAARSRQWAAVITANLDWITYATLLVFIGVPAFYATGYEMPFHLTVTILAYLAAMRLPASWRRFLHPILVTAFCTVIVIYVFGLSRGDDMDSTLRKYKTGMKYLQLWEGVKSNQRPGAGDLLGTVLDASIVALALPMFQFRRELREHFLAVVIPNVLLSIGSLFAYPPLCFALGISATRSLAFPVRSLTLALAQPAVANLGGDINTASALALMSGIVGALVGQRILAWLRIPDGQSIHSVVPYSPVEPLLPVNGASRVKAWLGSAGH
jgi:putative effector of murein hydrolase